MSKVLGSIFGFGDKIKRRLRDAASNPRDYLEMTADENQNEWRKNPEERSMGFFNPVPLGKVDPFLLRKQMKEAIDEIPSLSRRDFMKKSAGLAAGSTVGAGVTSKLLRKFAPEERAVVKEAIAEAAPKYKYNSLKEYLDDVETKAYSAHDNPVDYQMLGDDASSIPNLMKEQLLRDEQAYQNSKFFYRDNPNKIDPFSGKPLGKEFQTNIRNTLDDFSPQAKKEMKEYKDFVNQYRPSESGQGWARPDDIQDWINGDRIPF